MSRYAPPPPEAPRIERRQIPGGFTGTTRTAAHVARLIRDGARDFYVRQKAIDILLARGVPAKDYLGEIDALFRWVQRNVRYTRDPFRVEVLHAPRRMLELKAGDCDDMTILLGAMIKSVGHPVRIVLTGPNGRRPDLFSHIYLEAGLHGEWIPLDATMPHAMGWSPRAPVRLVLPVEEKSTDDNAPSRSIRGITTTAASPSASRARSGATRTAGAWVASGSDSQHPLRRSRTARSTSARAVDATAAAAAARQEPVAQGPAPLLLAERTGAETPPHHDAAYRGAAQKLGIAAAQRTARSAADPNEAALCDQTGGDPSTAASAPSPAGSPSKSRDGEADRARRPTSLGGYVRDAGELYRRFTRLPVRSIRRVAHSRLIPPIVVELGTLVGLIYRSDKWVGRPHTYIHYMEDPPRLVSDVAGHRLFLVGGSYRVTQRGIEG